MIRLARKKKVVKEVEEVEVLEQEDEQTTFNEDDMSIIYDDEGNEVECEDCIITDEVEEG